MHILYGPQWIHKIAWRFLEDLTLLFYRVRPFWLHAQPSNVYRNAVSSSLDTSMASTYTIRYPLRHGWQLCVVELSHLSPGWIALCPFRKHTAYCLLPLWPLQQSIIYNVSVWRTRLNCLKYVSLLRDKHCHLSLVGMEEMTLWQTATFPERRREVGGCRRSIWSHLSCKCFNDRKLMNVFITLFLQNTYPLFSIVLV